MTRPLIGIVVLSLVAATLWAADTEKRPQREQAFAAKLTGATMTGAFSLDGKQDKNQKEDKYQIVSAKKTEGDNWVITAKMKIGENELDVPIAIKVFWADDTPVMSLTDLTIPGLGTFTARVMFYGDRYAGTWQHGEAGGHMWGLIGKMSEKK